MSNSYPKAEKLCSRNIIDKLFADRHSVYEFPLKIMWTIEKLPENVPVQSSVTVSKHRFKRAYKRNLLKRRMREAFRLNKQTLYKKVENESKQLALMIIYNHAEILPYNQIETAMSAALGKIITKLEKEGAI